MAKPFVIIDLDKPRKLRYGINQIIILEELIGKSLSEMDLSKLSFKDLRSMIYAGLSWEDKEITPELVGDLIDEYSNIEEVSKKMTEAFEASFGEKK